MKTKKKLFAAEAIAFIYVAFVWKFLGIYFETNDDRYITEILAGIISVKPDGHAIYVNYLFSSFFSFLYQITTEIPWYGGFLVLAHWQCYAFLMDSFLEQFETLKGWAASIVASLLLFLSHMYILGQLQYTSTAILLAATGYICLILQRNNRKIGLFIVFETLAYFLRADSMMAMQPMGIAVYIGMTLLEETTFRNKMKKIACTTVIPILVISVGLVCNLLGYYSEEWREYQRYNDARTELTDYYCVPQYEDVSGILDRYQVSKEQYVGFCNYTVLDKYIPTECLEELANYAKKNQQQTVNLIELIRGRISLGIQSGSWSVNRLSTLIILATIVFMLLRREFRLMCPLIFLGAADMVVWGYLLIKGRMPSRVFIPLFFAESVLLISLMLWVWKRKRGTVWQTVATAIIGVALCAFSIFVISQEWPAVKQRNQSQEILFQGMYKLQDYCNRNPNQKYLIEANGQSYYMGSVFETKIYQSRNSLITGCWYSTSPAMEAKIKEYFADGVSGFYFIILSDGDVEQNPAMQYMIARQGCEPELKDTLEIFEGLVYNVYYFK